MKNILITGGAGFIGSHLAIKLIEKGYRITVLDNLSKQIHGEEPELNSVLYNSVKDKVSFIKGSVESPVDIEKAVEGQDCIVHFAAETGTGQSMYEIKRYADVNVGGTALLLDFLTNNKHRVKKVVVASSRAIYGEGKYLDETSKQFVYPGHRNDSDMKRGDFEVKFNGRGNLVMTPTDEEAKVHPSSVYGITKQNQEQMVMTVCPAIGIAPVAFRYQNVYGPGQSLSNPYTGILSIFSNLILKNKTINIFEDGLESRDFVYIDDVVNATILGIEKEEANGEVFNVGSGESASVIDIAKYLMQCYDRSVDTEISGNYRIGDIRHNLADLTKVKHKLGYKPSVNFKEGILRFSQWVTTQTIGESLYDQSINEMKNRGLYK